MIFLLLITLSLDSYAIGFIKDNSKETVTSKQLVNQEKSRIKKVYKTDKVSNKQSSTLNKDSFSEELRKRDLIYAETINQKLDSYYNNPIILERSVGIRSLDTFKGVLTDSLILTRSASEVIVKSSETDGPLENAKLRCLGGVVLQRVKIYCDLLVTPYKEHRVRVLIREDSDGASTLLPDKYYTGEEARFIKQSFASMFAGAMDASKERFLSDRGQEELVNSKNKIYEGLFNVGKNAQSELDRNASEVEIAAVVNSGRAVRIEFIEGVKYE